MCFLCCEHCVLFKFRLLLCNNWGTQKLNEVNIEQLSLLRNLSDKFVWQDKWNFFYEYKYLFKLLLDLVQLFILIPEITSMNIYSNKRALMVVRNNWNLIEILRFLIIWMDYFKKQFHILMNHYISETNK